MIGSKEKQREKLAAREKDVHLAGGVREREKGMTFPPALTFRQCGKTKKTIGRMAGRLWLSRRAPRPDEGQNFFETGENGGKLYRGG